MKAKYKIAWLIGKRIKASTVNTIKSGCLREWVKAGLVIY